MKKETQKGKCNSCNKTKIIWMGKCGSCWKEHDKRITQESQERRDMMEFPTLFLKHGLL